MLPQDPHTPYFQRCYSAISEVLEGVNTAMACVRACTVVDHVGPFGLSVVPEASSRVRVCMCMCIGTNKTSFFRVRDPPPTHKTPALQPTLLHKHVGVR